MRSLSLLICIAIFVTGIPFQVNAAITMKKFIKADSQVFVPESGEVTTISWNFETDHVANVMIMEENKVIAYLAKNQEYEGNYQVHELTWNGKDDSGNLVKPGTYKVVAQPQEEVYKKYKSITTVTVVADNSEIISISPAISGNTFKVYGKGGSNQGVNKVTLSVTKDGNTASSINATISNNLWYANLPMTAYSLYDVTATIKSSSGTSTKNITALRHVFRVSDRLVYLASAYYSNYLNDEDILQNNNLNGTFANEGELVNSNILILNPSNKVQQEIKSESDTTRQHLGVIDQLQRTASTNPVSLSMGNNFYFNEDISINGYIPLTFNRVYNSLSHSFNESGMNWSNSFTYYLQDMGDTIAVQFEDGHTEYYTKESDGTYKTAEGLVRELVVNGNKTYTLIVDGTQFFNFGKDGSLFNIKDLNGNSTELTYTNGMLTKVQNISGYFNLTYNTDGTIKTIKDSGNRSVSYSYTNGLVTGFTDVNGYKTIYSYDSLNRLSKVVSAEDITLLSVKYDTSDRVTSRTVQGSTYTYSYDDDGRSILCTEPNGNKITFHYTTDYRIESEEYSDGTVKYYYEDKSETTETANATKVDTVNTVNTASLSTDARNFSTNVSANKVLKTAGKASVLLLGQSVELPTLELKTHNMNTASGSAINNTLYPQFRIINTSSSTVNLSDITLRYYYTVDGERPQNFFCDYSSVGAGNVTGKFMKLTNPTSTADYYLEVGFTSGAGQLQSGESAESHVRIGKDDWSIFTPGNDYSQNMTSDFTYFDQVDMFYNGDLVWGKGSIGSGVTPSFPSPPASGGNQGNSGNNNTNPNTNIEDEIPTGTNKLKLQMYNTGNSDTTTNTIHPIMRLVNTGGNMVKLSDVALRYYYTADNKKPQNFWCDWSSVGSANIIGTFHTMAEPGEDADTYLEIGFKSGSGYIDIGGLVDIHIRIAKNDWTNYDITNDYSIRPAESFADWDKVDVFVKGTKVWGEGVIPGEEEREEEEHIDYANTTYTPVRVEMYNINRESSTNGLSPRFRIYNTGTEAIKLSDINIGYFYTTDGPEEQIFEADWAGIGSKFQTSISRGDITCEFTQVGDDNLSTNCAASIGFTRSDIKLQQGDYIELHVRIHRAAWTNYVQSNDYSLNTESTTFEEWNKIAVFVGGKWAFGSLPLTYAEVIDPDSDSEKGYPVDTKGSYGSNTDKSGNATYYSYDTNGNITSSVDALGNKTEYSYNIFNQVTSITDALGNETTYDYDNKGNLTSVIDALGNETKFTYNSLGCLTKVEMADGSFETRTYDSKGNLKNLTDANGNINNFAYDTLNRITGFTDGNGNAQIYEYTADGKVSKVTDALGYISKSDYNKDGQVVTQTNQNGKATKYQYSTSTGLLSQITDALAGVESYKYDNMGNLTEVTAADGSKTTYTYDLFGRTTAVTDGEGNITSYNLDTNGNVTEETDALGIVTQYTYDKLNRLTEVTDGEGGKTTYTYDVLGRTIKEIDALGGVTAYQYDAVGNLLQSTDALGNVTKQGYNNVGLLTSSTDSKGNKTTYEYDAGGRQTKQTDSEGGILSWAYDKNDNLTTETNELGNTVNYTYDKLNRLTQVTDALGKTTGYTYDGVGNKTKETNALGNNTSYVYDALNNLTQITDALGTVTKYEYNKAGHLTKEMNGLGKATIYEYDKNGNQVKVTDALGYSTTYTYDSSNRMTAEKDTLGNIISYTYDKTGNLLRKKDAKGGITTYEYDALSNLTKVMDALGHIAEYTYDKNGNITKETRLGETPTKNQTTSYTYDKNGNMTSLTDALGQKVTYEYDNKGQLLKETAKDNISTIYGYDLAGNLTKKTFSDNHSVKYAYNKNNQLISMIDWNGSTEYEYDDLGQTTKVTDSKNQVVAYTWTKIGQKKTMTYPDGSQVQYEYDKAGNLSKVTDTNNGITIYTYDDKSQLTGKTLPNGAKSAYTYDSIGQLTNRVEKTGSVIKESYSYEYDAKGNRTGEIKITGGITGTTLYTYDGLNQLTRVTDGNGITTYNYDEFNNRISKVATGEDSINYIYNDLNELTQEKQGSVTKTYTYDKRGNLSTEKDNSITTISYTFDSTNMLIKVRNTGINITSEYTYDGTDNRIQTMVTEDGSVTSIKNYVIDTQSMYGDIITAEELLTGKDSDFTYGNGLVSVETSGSLSYYRIDEKSSVEEIQSTTGSIQAEIRYDEFGKIENTEEVYTNGNIFAYTGHVYDEGTEQYYAKARYYDADSGRFISEDSYRGDIYSPGSLNLYIYVFNNPNKYIDPTGKAAVNEGGSGCYLSDSDYILLIQKIYNQREKLIKNRKYIYEPYNWEQELNNNLKVLLKWIPANLPDSQRQPLIDTIIILEAQSLQDKYSSVYFYSSSLISKYITERKLNKTLKPLFTEYPTKDRIKNKTVKAFIDGFVNGFQSGVMYGSLKWMNEKNITKLYRVMSESEYDTLMKTGGFTQYDMAMESKWFATNVNDAAKWGKLFYPNGNYKMVEIQVPTSALNGMYFVEKLDNIGAAYNAERDFINKVLIGIIEVTK